MLCGQDFRVHLVLKGRCVGSIEYACMGGVYVCMYIHACIHTYMHIHCIALHEINIT